MVVEGVVRVVVEAGRRTGRVMVAGGWFGLVVGAGGGMAHRDGACHLKLDLIVREG